MKVHANAPHGPKGRETMVRRVLEVVKRYLAEGEAGLLDRSSASKSIPHRTSEELVEVIVLLRKLRMTGAEIALCLAIACTNGTRRPARSTGL